MSFTKTTYLCGIEGGNGGSTVFKFPKARRASFLGFQFRALTTAEEGVDSPRLETILETCYLSESRRKSVSLLQGSMRLGRKQEK
jgi:hypothetical protein